MVHIIKKDLWLISIICLFLIGILVVMVTSLNQRHQGNKILIKTNNYVMTLPEAISREYLVDGGNIASADLTTQLSGPSHDSSEIYVSVDGVENNLNDAIGGLGLCGTFDSSYGSNIIMGHSGEEVNVTIESIEKSLQEAINNGDFCCVPDCSAGCGDDSCGGSCGICTQVVSEITYVASARRWSGVGGYLNDLIDGELGTGISYSIQSNWYDANALVTVTFTLDSPSIITRLRVTGDCTYLAVVSGGTETQVSCSNPTGNWENIDSIKWSGKNLYTQGCGIACTTHPNGRTSNMYELEIN